MYEHRTDPLLPRRQFAQRLARHVAVAFGIISVSLSIGLLGYHFIERLGWVDSLFNAAMIFTSEGPAAQPATPAGKIFASIYALASVIILLSTVSLLLAPVFHRGLHKFHLEEAARKKAGN